MQDFAAWLGQIGLGKYAETFRDNDIDFDVVRALDDGELKELGLSLGDRKRLRQAIEGLETAPTAATVSAGSNTVGADRRQLTVLFSDMVGSTGLSRDLDPEDLRDVMRAYHEAVGAAVRGAGGFVAKLMGDGLMAYFGYPQASEDAAERAVRAGLQAIAAVKVLAPVRGQTLSTRVGIATGAVVVGDVVGEDVAREVNVVGETPNLAARLQGIAAPGTVVIAETTRRLIGSQFGLVRLGEQSIRGIAEPVVIYEVSGERRGVSRFEASRNAQRSRFVGRGQEVGLLLDRWEQAKGGDGQIVLLSGEAGIGKSRITETMYQRVAETEHHRIRYQCSPQHVGSPLFPATEQIAVFAGIDFSDDPAGKMAKIAAAMPAASADDVTLIASLMDVPIPSNSPLASLTPARRRQMTLEAFTSQLEELCRERPVLWVVEDAHWIDPTTEDLISRVVERSARQRLLIMVTHRPEYRAPWSSDPIATQLVLNRLSRTLVTSLLEGLGGGKTVPPAVIDYVTTRTDGVPLYVEEMFQALRDSGVLRETADTFEVVRPLDGAAVPTTLQDSLMARLDRLAPAKAVAQLGAAIGREFDHSLLVAIAGMRLEALREGIDQLLAAGLIFARGAVPDVTYSFKHALVQDAAYGSMLRDRRQDIHRRIAESLADAVGARAEVLAHHYEAAGDLEGAGTWFDRAGEGAMRASAGREAIDFWQRALRVSADAPASPSILRLRLGLNLRLSTAYSQTQGYAATAAADAGDTGMRLADELGDMAVYARTCVMAAPTLFGRQRFAQVEERLARLSDADIERLDVWDRAMFRCLRGVVHWHLGRFADSLRDLSAVDDVDGDSRPIEPTFGGGDLRVVGRTYLSRVQLICGFQERSRRNAHRSLDIARAFNDPFSVAWAGTTLSRLHITVGAYGEAKRVIEESIALCERHGFSYRLGMGMALHGMALVGDGDVERGNSEIERGLRLWRESGGAFALEAMLAEVAGVFVGLGQFEFARHYLTEARLLHETAAERTGLTHALWIEGLLAEADGDRPLAIQRLREATNLASEQAARRHELIAARHLARMLAEDGRTIEAQAVLAPVYEWFTEGLDTPDLKAAKGLLDSLA